MLARRRRYRFDVRAGLGFLGDGEASVTPSSFGESAAPVGPVSVTPTGFGGEDTPSISAASLVSATVPEPVSASQESAALFAPASLSSEVLKTQGANAAALKVPS